MTIKDKIKHIFALIRAYFPSPLPQTMKAFKPYAESICTLYDFPTDDGYINMIAQMIQHASPTAHSIPKRYFMLRMRKAVSNEIAFWVMQDLKLQKTKAEATAPPPICEGACANGNSQKPLQEQAVS